MKCNVMYCKLKINKLKKKAYFVLNMVGYVSDLKRKIKQVITFMMSSSDKRKQNRKQKKKKRKVKERKIERPRVEARAVDLKRYKRTTAPSWLHIFNQVEFCYMKVDMH